MDWMRYLQQQGHIADEVDLESLLRQPGGPAARRPRQRGGPAAHRRRASGASGASAFEEIFSSLDRAGPGYHPIRAAGEGIERLPETRPYEFGDDIHLLDPARSLQNAMRRHRRASSTSPRRTWRSTRPST